MNVQYQIIGFVINQKQEFQSKSLRNEKLTMNVEEGRDTSLSKGDFHMENVGILRWSQG